MARPRKTYSLMMLAQAQAIAVQEGGTIGPLATRDEVIATRNAFYSLRASVMNEDDMLRRLLGDLLADLSGRIERDPVTGTYSLHVSLNPFAASGRTLLGMTPADSLRTRYRYAKEVGLEYLIKQQMEHLLVETQP